MRYDITTATLSERRCVPDGPRHVTHVGYPNAQGTTSVVTSARMVQILQEPGNTAQTNFAGLPTDVLVYECQGCRRKYVRTSADMPRMDDLHHLRPES